MGKTWLLHELGRRLSEWHGFLVGYHESKGQTPDHLLRCVSDLYSRWLADASNVEQAKSLWKRHRSRLFVGAGQAVGRLFAAVPGLEIGEGIAST